MGLVLIKSPWLRLEHGRKKIELLVILVCRALR